MTQRNLRKPPSDAAKLPDNWIQDWILLWSLVSTLFDLILCPLGSLKRDILIWQCLSILWVSRAIILNLGPQRWKSKKSVHHSTFLKADRWSWLLMDQESLHLGLSFNTLRRRRAKIALKSHCNSVLTQVFWDPKQRHRFLLQGVVGELWKGWTFKDKTGWKPSQPWQEGLRARVGEGGQGINKGAPV